jgi:hypothetical protein
MSAIPAKEVNTVTNGHIYAFLSGMRVQCDPTGSGNHNDEHGYVDPNWSRTDLFESRNDVRPIVDCDIRDEDLADYVREAIEGLGLPSDNGDGRFYGQDEHAADDGSVWTYALTFIRKFHGPNGWTEQDWHPANDGGLDFSGIRFY